MITIKEVAKYTQCSVATVSRVLNDDPSVTKKTRAKVVKGIQELGYVPNYLGRNLRKVKTDIFYVLLPSIDNSFYAKIVQSIEKEAMEKGISIMICETYNEYKRYDMFMDAVRNKLADGIILISPGKKKDLPAFDDISVAICCETNGYNCNQVDIDNAAAAYDVVSHMIGLGKKRIAFVGGDFTSGHLRKKGYMEALASAGLAVDERLILENNYYNYEDGLLAGETIIKGGIIPDAVFAVTDHIAFGIIKSLLKAAYRVPQDIAVAGFDNLTYAKMHNPSLTTILQPRQDMGKIVFHLLYDSLHGEKKQNQRIILPHRLIERYSTTGRENKEEV